MNLLLIGIMEWVSIAGRTLIATGNNIGWEVGLSVHPTLPVANEVRMCAEVKFLRAIGCYVIHDCCFNV